LYLLGIVQIHRTRIDVIAGAETRGEIAGRRKSQRRKALEVNAEKAAQSIEGCRARIYVEVT